MGRSATNNTSGSERLCDRQGCTLSGKFRAPVSRNDLNNYYWFCLEHIREYNAAWDYFDGMDPAEIEAFNREDVTGHRPTWPLGAVGSQRCNWNVNDIADLFASFAYDRTQPSVDDDSPPGQLSEERRALAVLNLPPTATSSEIKCRFKELVKDLHPDLNGGDKADEERLKEIIEAYRSLPPERHR